MHRKKRGGKKAGTGAVQVMNTGRRRSVVEWGARTHDSNSARQAAHADFHVVAKEARVKHATDNWNKQRIEGGRTAGQKQLSTTNETTQAAVHEANISMTPLPCGDRNSPGAPKPRWVVYYIGYLRVYNAVYRMTRSQEKAR
jgi:hypothetical protein